MAAVALLASCRLHVDAIRIGSGWTPSDYQAVVVGEHGRGDVLDLLGPPDEVTYTLSREIFLYRIGGHRGSDLRLLVPDSLVNVGRPGLEFLSPGRDEPDAFQVESPPVLALERAVGFVLGFFNPISTDEGLGFFGRRLRWNVVRLVLDRETHVVLAKELLSSIQSPALGGLLREAVLLEDDDERD